MTLSINTNTAALAALQSLSQTSADLTQTENRVSTGKAVNSASDNPAVYAIAQTMNSQIGALKGVQSGLSFAGQVVNTAAGQATLISNVLSSLSQSITSAETTGYNVGIMNAALSQAMSQINSAASGSTFQGVNLLGGAIGNGVQYTSVSTAMDVNGTLFTQGGYNATATGLGLSNLNVAQSGAEITFGATDKGLGGLAAGDSLAINNIKAGADGKGTGTAADPAVQYQFLASSYAGTGTLSVADKGVTAAQTALATAVGSAGGTTAVVIAADGSLTFTGAKNVTSQTQSDGSVVYSFGSTSDETVTQARDASGNFTYSVSTAFDKNGAATAFTNISLADIGPTGAPANSIASSFTSAVQNAGFGVSQDANTGAVMIAGNNIDAADAGATTSSVTLTSTGAGTPAVQEVSGSASALLTVQAAISKMNTIASGLGAAANQVSQLSTTTSSLSNALTTGVGALTDADLAAESAKLTSLQTKQQLAIQSLSIANSQSSSILSLFRG
ncbi:flagellin [Brytella acorum]|uniref:Flagellin n=1 Tax=Brytella acorum TaxID=2959299 RepID=A0AA35UY03_9PROT|nr:flagellin [Brytella acorum]MDF3625400.1 flagellin [Brytella acorum]CAI9121536.1 flagellin [Brytella acorum]